jgi:uncharacterized protein (TIGR00255 family)
MTGHGEAHQHDAGLAIGVEIRTVNNRYFKLNLRLTEGYAPLESHVETLIRQQIRRGTVQTQVAIDREPRPEDYRINQPVLSGYVQQLEAAFGGKFNRDAGQLASLLALPGVVHEPTAEFEEIEAQWPRIEAVVKQALDRLTQMRVEEGRSMATDLAANAKAIAVELARIEARAPAVIESYRTRLSERVSKWLSDSGLSNQPTDVIREVALFAERSDISEEIVRLRSHLEQFAAVMAEGESQGRKLEFLTQEMFRETNTIGSKANDAEIARHVIEIKTAIERMREMIQNVE